MLVPDEEVTSWLPRYASHTHPAGFFNSKLEKTVLLSYLLQWVEPNTLTGPARV